MKPSCFVLFLLSIVAMCCHEENPKPYVLGIDIQSSFDNDFVEVSLDGTSIIKEALSTNHVLGVCPEGRERVDVSAGRTP